MAQADAGTSSPATPSKNQPPLCVVHIAGRVTHRRRYKTREGAVGYSFIIKTPAPDAFTSPGTLEVHSSMVLGEVGEDVHVVCRLSGYGRSYNVTDPDTGDKHARQTADLRLTVI